MAYWVAHARAQAPRCQTFRGPYVKERLETASAKPVINCERPSSAGLTATRSRGWTDWQCVASSQRSSPRAEDGVAAASSLDFLPLSAEFGEDSFARAGVLASLAFDCQERFDLPESKWRAPKRPRHGLPLAVAEAGVGDAAARFDGRTAPGTRRLSRSGLVPR